MDYRGVLLTCAVLGAGVLGSATACSGPDPGAITFSERPGQIGEPQGSTSSSSGASGSTSTSSGTPAAPDAGAFFKEAFNYQDPGVAANNANAAHGGTVEGRDCVIAGCHLGGVAPWLFGGTVYTAPANGQTVAKAEVLIVGPDGAEVGKAHTDANGNFWMEAADGKTIPAGSKVGVRNEGGAVQLMATPISNADAGCTANRANCHGTAAQGNVWVN